MSTRVLRTAVTTVLVLGLFAAVAQAQLALHLAGPHRTRTGTIYTVTGTNYGQAGATFLGVYYDRNRCPSTFTKEYDRGASAGSRNAGELLLLALPGGAPFTYPVKMVKSGGKARWLCGYLYQGTRTGGGFHTLRHVALGI